LWFVTLHPFDDGNGRIARVIGDLLLSRADGSSQRFYSLSAQIQCERKAYYEILETTQKQSMDVTQWLNWFLNTLDTAINQPISARKPVGYQRDFLDNYHPNKTWYLSKSLRKQLHK
jgi:Fic family protein